MAFIKRSCDKNDDFKKTKKRMVNKDGGLDSIVPKMQSADYEQFQLSNRVKILSFIKH